MLKRKLASIALLIALLMAAVGLRFATVTSLNTGTAQTTPADPIPIPIGPPPH